LALCHACFWELSVSDLPVGQHHPQSDVAAMGRAVSPAAEALGLGVSVVVGGLILVFALWYTSSGLFPEFPKIQNDLVDLGSAFLRGQLSLLEQPDPRLADLGNPYEYTQRKGLPYHWDASYYDGKYYLYWGPAPALVSAGLQALTGAPPSASLLVVLPFLGLMVVAGALLWILAESFGSAARLTVWLFIAVLSFNLPMLVTIGQPRHYQASILWGQFFLLLGMLGVAQHLRGRSAAWLGLAGVAWGLAVASRYNLAISVVIYCTFLAIWFGRYGLRSLWRRAVLMLIPVALSLFGLGLYNLARFGDPMETGLSYQLTIPEFRHISYSLSYVPSGLFAYLMYPLTAASEFPFIQDAHFQPSLIPDSIPVPQGREFDQITFGLFTTVPAIWAVALALPLAVSQLTRTRGSRSTASSAPWPGLVLSMLAAGVAGQFLFLLVFFYIAERYLIDFYVPLIICLAGIIWYADLALRSRPGVRIAFWICVAVLTWWTAAIGFFGCFGVPVLVSLYYDPQMLANLAAFWNERYASIRQFIPALR
jgi:hypothetical protein